MLLRNNPNIDFDTLESEVSKRIEHYQESLSSGDIPEYDAQRLEKVRLDMASLQHSNISGGLNLLYALEDRDFVFYAYNLFLGRPPTEQEAAVCTERLRSGENKSRVACELRYSDEGKDKNSDISLSRERLAYKLISVPVVGFLFNLLSIIASLPALKTVSQAKENHQYRLMESLKRDLNRKNQQVIDLKNEINALRGDLDRALNDLRAELGKVDSALASSRTRLSFLEQKQTASPSTATAPAASPGEAYNDDSLYAAFEERYRGSADTIRERLSYYLPLIESSLNSLESASIVDIGCGRGEWLELLQKNSFQGVGIDTNVHNIANCQELGLTAFHEDALTWLARQEDRSLGCISAFHVIEHLDFSQLNFFIDQALRCLCEGGLLLLETPNPENLLVGSSNFYLDPTHVRPLPPGLMEFLLSYKGFQDVSVHRLHPVATELMIAEDTEVARRCNQLFYEAQDYAVTGVIPRNIA